MADVPDPITSVPAQPWQPYDGSSTDTVAGWDKLDTDDFPDGPGPWRQL